MSKRRVGEPIGEAPRWFEVFDFVSRLPAGTLVTWADFEEALGPQFDRDDYRGPIQKASWRLVSQHGRRLVSVKGVGYRISEPRDALPQAKAFGRRIETAAVKNHRHAQMHDRTGLDAQTNASLDQIVASSLFVANEIARANERKRRLTFDGQTIDLTLVDLVAVRSKMESAVAAARRAAIESLTRPSAGADDVGGDAQL